MREQIEDLFQNKKEGFNAADFALFYSFIEMLNKGQIRSAEKADGRWRVNEWVKKGILLGFRMGYLQESNWGDAKTFIDKHTYPERQITLEDKVRIVPGGSSVRTGCYLGKSVTIMPPSYINVGAYVDDNTMVDSHALVGSCAQVGKNVHVSAGAMLGGVLEPIGANPVIIEDNVFIGGNTGIYEGVIVCERAIIAAGVILTSSTPVFNAVTDEFLPKEPGRPVVIPARAVVVAGSRPLKTNPDYSVYCPIIIKFRDEKSDSSVALEQELR